MLGRFAVSVVAVSSLTATGSTITASVDFSQQCDFAVAPNVISHVAIAFDGICTVAIGTKDTHFGAASFDSVGTFNAKGGLRQSTDVAFGGNGNFGVTAKVTKRSFVNFSGIFSWQVVTAVAVDPYDNIFIDSEGDIESIKALIEDGLSTTRRPGALTFDYLTAFSLGPQLIGAADTGILGWAWYVRAEGNSVFYARSNDAYDGWEDEQVLFNFSGAQIDELDLAFEENGRIVISAERATGAGGTPEVWLYWYKPSLAAFTFEKFDSGRTPRVVLDNPNDTTIADVQFAYMKEGSGLVTRLQREDYATMHTSVFHEYTDWSMEEFARNRGNRLVAILSKKSGDEYYLGRVESTLYPFYNSDTFALMAKVLPQSTLQIVSIITTLEPEKYSIIASVLDTSTLATIVITHSLFDKDTFAILPSVLDTSTLVVVIIVPVMFDKDELQVLAEVLDTSTLVQIVITHSLFDKDMIKLAADVLPTSTLEVA